MVWWAWHWRYTYVMAFSFTRSEPNRAFMEYSGTMPETAFSTSIKQVWVDWLSRERMVFQTSSRIPDAGGLYATAHTGRTGRTWWPNTLLSDFTLVFPLLVWSLIPQNDTNPVHSLFPGYCDHHCPSPLLPQLFLFGSCRLFCSFLFHPHFPLCPLVVFHSACVQLVHPHVSFTPPVDITVTSTLLLVIFSLQCFLSCDLWLKSNVTMGWQF